MFASLTDKSGCATGIALKFEDVKHIVFAEMYPVETKVCKNDKIYELLRDSMEKLKLNDISLIKEPGTDLHAVQLEYNFKE